LKNYTALSPYNWRRKQLLADREAINMNTWTLTLVVVLLASCCWAAPATQERIETDPELTAGYIQGDMVPSPEGRNGLRNEAYRWPNRIVYYYINRDIGKDIYSLKRLY